MSSERFALHFVKPTDILTGNWREGDSAPRYSDAALQLVPYMPPTNADIQRYYCRRSRSPLQDRQDLVKGLCNPLVWHRHPVSLSRLYNAITPLEKATKLVRSTRYQESWDARIQRAISQSDEAWQIFLVAFARESSDDVAEDGAVTGMWQGDKKRRQAVDSTLLKLGHARERCIEMIQQMCLMNERGWSPGQRSLASIEFKENLEELTDFAILLGAVDVSLGRAIRGVVKKMVAKGKKMHESNVREGMSKKGEEGLEDGIQKLVI